MIVSSSKMNFKEVVDDILRKEYYPEVVRVTYEVVPQVAKEAASKLRSESPKRQGKYSRGWASKVDKGRVSVGATVYGKDGTYQLAHLLEHGHAKRGGGRTAAIEHIKPVEEWAIDKAYNDIMDKLEGI
jgi:hypothetical protein